MFGREYDYSLIRTTSKEALLRSALMVSNNDIKKASEICDYFTKQLPNLPDTDPVLPSTFDQVKDTAVKVFQWGQQNQDQVMSVLNFVMSLFGKEPIGTVLTETPKPIV